MLDIQLIKDNPEKVKQAAKLKKVDVDIDLLLELDKKRRQLRTETDGLRAERNRLSQHQDGKPSAQSIAKVKDIKKQLDGLESDLERLEAEYLDLAARVPNLMHESVPEGQDDSDNQVVREVNQPAEFSFTPQDHLELGRRLDMIDMETAAYTSGSRFYYLKNDAVRLEFALISWLINKYTDKGFTPVLTPQLVREHMLFATGFLPAEAGETYRVNPGEDDLYLIGTSEITLAGLHMQEPIRLEDLPKRYIGFSTCFRREAGSYGQDTRGVFRVHQFDKLEMYSFTHPDESWQEHEFLLSIEEEILQELKLPYRVVNVCSGDLGSPAAKKYDCEAWVPSQERYRELTSCSNTTDFQARRGNIKFTDGKTSHYLHTLNGTAMASTRMLIAIMENYQTKTGSIKVPSVLQPFMNKEEIK